MTTKQIGAIVGALVCLLASVTVLWVLKSKLELEDGISFTTVLLLPVLVYLILADKISSFKAGEIEATFKEVANEKVAANKRQFEQLVVDEDLALIQKGGTNQLEHAVQALRSAPPTHKIIMTLQFGRTGYYNKQAVGRYLTSLSDFKNFKFISVVDIEDRLVAFIEKDRLEAILRNENLGNEFIRVINDGDHKGLEYFPGLITNVITDDSKNIAALKEMDKHKTDELLVVGADEKIKGVVKREDILSKLMIALAQ